MKPIKLTLGQLVILIGIITTIFTLGRAWENHDQRIKALESKQEFLHGSFTMPER